MPSAQVLSIGDIRRRRSAARNTRREGLPEDRGYRFADYDPILEEVRAAIRDSELTVSEILEKVLDASGNAVNLSYATVAHWLDGKTRRPQNYTLTWVLFAIGIERPLVRLGPDRSYAEWMVAELRAAGYEVSAP